MALKNVKSALESVLNIKLKESSVPVDEWAEGSGKSRINGNELHIKLYTENDFIYYWTLPSDNVTALERRLIELAVHANGAESLKSELHTVSLDEQLALQLRDWLCLQLERGNSTNVSLPAQLLMLPALSTQKIPILIYGDYADHRRVYYEELKDLLGTFFQVEIMLIPLQGKEWLILVSDEVLNESEDNPRDYKDAETLNESLESICSGLYDMLATEWIGECHLSVVHPIVPAQDLVGAVARLREAMLLGKKYHYDLSLHYPWQLHLEKLLHSLPTENKQYFLDQIFKYVNNYVDQETIMTLETFFELDCNVSETAKKLYIHRNTLLYRLEKFKQETGLDVRNFNQAVLVKIALLLYKVTKRK